MLALFTLLPLLCVTGAAPSRRAAYTLTVGSLGPWTTPDDTPANSFIAADGGYWFQSAHALYGASASRAWSFYSGANLDSATKHAISSAVNPADSRDSNADTTWRCNNSPTGVVSSYANGSTAYSQRNFCDLAGVWVDPDTGDWVGLVHNEFSPQPFGDGLHFDGIDRAVSSDGGKTWRITERIITSPYSTARGNTTAFPQSTYAYGDGDPRLTVDVATGYFYVYYGSRVVNKGGSWVAFYAHVARAPMASKMVAGSWKKYYAGGWTQPGVGGAESNLVPVSTYATGYTPPSKEYNPNTPGTAAQQIAAGTAPPTSPLFVGDATYSAHLGVFISQPQAVDQSGKAPQKLYVSSDLVTWSLAANTGTYTTASWYRWLLDPVSKTSSQIVGKAFRSYCSFGCSGGKSGEYVNLALDGTPFTPVTPGNYVLTSNGGGEGGAVTLARLDDGAYTIAQAGKFVCVDDTSNSGRAWGAKVAPKASAGVGAQWWIIPNRNSDRSADGTFRVINRYSGLALSLSSNTARQVDTTPVRAWDAPASGISGGRKAAEQVLVFKSA
ncbi:hypothetical protein VHUM_01110 [Vanrija humicola]|uniref:Ricin B lectin domain-containing protein n=1 Tax=Vanrija humicola TaxID=5417 RepID=A0A7D8V2U5_VANHU|nr:hypothetical protein VHUM_01110 [Vanrija humicola]